MNSPFDAIEAAQVRSLERLHLDDTPKELVRRLLETSVLLELAKLEASSLDPATYLQFAVDALAQLYPVTGVAARLSSAGLPEIAVHAGVRPTDHTAAGRWPLALGEGLHGELVAGEVTVDLGPSRFFADAAEQLSSGLVAAVEAELLKRRAATATAARIAAGLDGDPVTGLEHLVDALAAFPGVVGAELVVDHTAVGAPLAVNAGYWAEDGRERDVSTVVRELPGTGLLAARLRAADAVRADDVAVREVLESLAASLERIARTRSLEEQAETDPLTGLGNRRRLERGLASALARAERYGERVAVLVVDLDEFKHVNDTLGHDVGDRVVLATAEVLRDRVRRYDETVRLGGDEFVVLAPVVDVLGAAQIGEAIRAAVPERCARVLPDERAVTCSIGVALYPDSASDAEGLLRAADEAMYEAKSLGRDTVVVARPDDAALTPGA